MSFYFYRLGTPGNDSFVCRLVRIKIAQFDGAEKAATERQREENGGMKRDSCELFFINTGKRVSV